ncbi:HAD family hydrolase [Leisingera thetidis]|uniref:HAD family hydrolase n=1 Tax=Leisingera thetidis TaxID=2930199 RepID=UPI0021F7855A|nr:HAD family phosphatase [Leisingera thetidis]
MPVNAVVFDIGRVLIEWEPERFYDSRIGAPRRQQLFEQVPLHAMNLDVDRGAPFRETVYALADAHPQWREEIRWWHDCWLQMVPREIPRTVRLMQALQARGIPVFALSNFGAETFELACGAYPALRGFDHTCVSAHLGTIKPEPQIYAILERGTGVAPENLLFTDDRPENIEAARLRGWQTHLFTAPGAFAARLVQEGLLTEQEAA